MQGISLNSDLGFHCSFSTRETKQIHMRTRHAYSYVETKLNLYRDCIAIVIPIMTLIYLELYFYMKRNTHARHFISTVFVEHGVMLNGLSHVPRFHFMQVLSTALVFHFLHCKFCYVL